MSDYENKVVIGYVVSILAGVLIAVLLIPETDFTRKYDVVFKTGIAIGATIGTWNWWLVHKEEKE